MLHFRKLVAGLGAVAAIAVSAVFQPASALESGDTVRIVVPYRAGGGYDSQARLAAPYVEAALRKAGLEGVSVIVENVTGGGGAIATAMAYNANPDGKTVLFLDPESSIWQQALAGAPFEVDRFSFIAQMSVDPMVFMIRTNLGLESFDAVVKRSQTQPILMGTSGAGSYDHIMPLILQRMLNDAGTPIAFDYVHFDGTAPIIASMKRGEAEASLEVISTFGGLEESGEVVFMFDFIEEDVPAGRWPDASSVLNLSADDLALFASAMNYRRVFVGPPEMGADTLATLRAAFETALKDPELIKKSEESRRPITFVGGEAIRAAVQKEAELAKKFAPLLGDIK